MKFNNRLNYIALSTTLLVALGWVGCSESVDSAAAPSQKSAEEVDAGEPNRQVRIETNYGEMVVELSNQTPEHRDNFLELVETGFYDSLLFHRVIDGFMIQGGDPNSRGATLATPLGTGGPGYQISAEIRPDLLHYKGALAAARQGDAVNPERKSSGSQFYLVHGKTFTKTALLNIEARNFPPEGAKYSEEAIERYGTEGGTPFLDNQYTVFGYVVEGLPVIDSIAAVPTAAGDRPLQDVWMAMEIIE